MTTELAPRPKSIMGISLTRPRWDNLVLAASLTVFWAGLIVKIFG